MLEEDLKNKNHFLPFIVKVVSIYPTIPLALERCPRGVMFKAWTAEL